MYGVIYKRILGIAVLALILYAPFAAAADLTSTSFIIRDPLVGTGGSFGTSSSFSAYGSGDMTMIGSGSSASFTGRYGFLWYPYATAPVLSVIQNGLNADLTWTASVAGQGWNVSGYSVGTATVSGGPYSYTSVGNVTAYSYTNLAPGYYCYIVKTLDAFSNVIATSNEACLTITPILTFSISTNTLQFGTLSASGARYATTSGGAGVDTVGHTMTASSNAPNGYTITYRGPTLASGANTIAPATAITGSGTAGTPQFALSLATSGSATIASGYANPTKSFVANTATSVATTSGATSVETFSNRYLANISSGTPAGAYSTAITYVITGNF